MNYAYTLQSDGIDYGIVKGGSDVVFIKLGLGESCTKNEFYYAMSHHLCEEYGCSVIIASNPNDGKKHAAIDKRIIDQYISNNDISSTSLFFFGHSNGGIKGIELTNEGVSFKKMILVNMPLMINFHKTKKYISEIPHTEVVMVYGDRDPSFPYLPFVRNKWSNVTVMAYENTDHNFNGRAEEFIRLSDMLFVK